ncbi:MAG TPA: hypothetical protein VLV56_08610 [Burkholderiales bacterium]|nr:hypothetical protein [Burkholderiales bacterium]
MNGRSGRNELAVDHGSLLRLGETRAIAIYQRGGAAWVADFRGDRGELFSASTWFALNGRWSLLRRAGLGSIAPVAPLPAEVIERIERLHRAEERDPLAALAAWLGDRLARIYAVPGEQRN